MTRVRYPGPTLVGIDWFRTAGPSPRPGSASEPGPAWSHSHNRGVGHPSAARLARRAIRSPMWLCCRRSRAWSVGCSARSSTNLGQHPHELRARTGVLNGGLRRHVPAGIRAGRPRHRRHRRADHGYPPRITVGRDRPRLGARRGHRPHRLFLGGCCVGRPTASRWGLWASDRRLGLGESLCNSWNQPLPLLIGLAALLVDVAFTAHRGGVVFIAAIAAYTLGRQLLFPLRDLPRANRLGPASHGGTQRARGDRRSHIRATALKCLGCRAGHMADRGVPLGKELQAMPSLEKLCVDRGRGSACGDPARELCPAGRDQTGLTWAPCDGQAWTATDLSAATGEPIERLRAFADAGLLVRRDDGRYDPDALNRVRLIRFAREHGVDEDRLAAAVTSQGDLLGTFEGSAAPSRRPTRLRRRRPTSGWPPT